MAASNEVRVKVTLTAEQKNDGSKIDKLWYEFLGDYVFPPSSASLGMCCGKRVFARIYDSEVGMVCKYIYFPLNGTVMLAYASSYILPGLYLQHSPVSPLFLPPMQIDQRNQSWGTTTG